MRNTLKAIVLTVCCLVGVATHAASESRDEVKTGEGQPNIAFIYADPG